MKNTNNNVLMVENVDIKEMIMTEEIEEVLQNMSRKENRVKRGPEIRNKTQGIIYALMYLKDMFNAYRPYSMDWFDLFENQPCKILINSIMVEIEYSINITKQNCNFEDIKNSIENIKNNIEKLKLVTGFYEYNYNFNTDVSVELATFPLYTGLEMISKALKELQEIAENCMELEE